MPRQKSTPVANRSGEPGTEPGGQLIIDDTPEDDDVVLLTPTTSTASPKKSKARRKSKSELPVSSEFRLFLNEAAFYLTIHCEMDDKLPRTVLGKLCVLKLRFVNDEGQPMTRLLAAEEVDLKKLYLFCKNESDEYQLYFDNSALQLGINYPVQVTVDRVSFIQSKNEAVPDGVSQNGEDLRKEEPENLAFDLADAFYSSWFVLIAHLNEKIVEIDGLDIDVWLDKSAVKKLPIADYSYPAILQPNVKLMTAMSHLFDYPPPENTQQEPPLVNLNNIYDLIKRNQLDMRNSLVQFDVQHSLLRPKLRNYQVEAVRWMLLREQQPKTNENCLYEVIKSLGADGNDCHLLYNLFGGYFVDNSSDFKSTEEFRKACSKQAMTSGILADEMGLGKTIEVLSCILCNQNPDSRVKEVEFEDVAHLVDIDNQKDYFECVCGSNFDDYDIHYVDDFVVCKKNAKAKRLKTKKNNKSGKVIRNKKDNKKEKKKLVKSKSKKSRASTSKINGSTSQPNRPTKTCQELNHDTVAVESEETLPLNENVQETIPSKGKKAKKKSKGASSQPKKQVNHQELDEGSTTELEDNDSSPEATVELGPSLRLRRRKVRTRKPAVRCLLCGSYQHAACVSFDCSRHRNYYCAHCWVNDNMPLVGSRATLIVSPRSISHQWREEILKHVDVTGLSILEYEGVKSQGYVQPLDLADHDLVLTTYEVLRSELDYVDLPPSVVFRNRKRFNTTPTPLLSVDWWRVCLDEAQMVDSPLTKVAQMAGRLSARNRWCVTGTPIQRSVNDLYGLLLFTGQEPVKHWIWWQQMVFKKYCAGDFGLLVGCLQESFWKTQKKDVWDQIDIPAQVETIKTLTFAPVEKHFYMRQHEDCRESFLETLTRIGRVDLNAPLKELDRKLVSKLMKPLLTLPQACCHPQAIRGKFLPLSKRTMTMKDLLDEMIRRTQYECEEEHRKTVSSINGIAAIHMITEEWAKAVEAYRKALGSIDYYKTKNLFRTDKLQQYHTLFNLAEVLERCGIKQKEEEETKEEESKSNSDPTSSGSDAPDSAIPSSASSSNQSPTTSQNNDLDYTLLTPLNSQSSLPSPTKDNSSQSSSSSSSGISSSSSTQIKTSEDQPKYDLQVIGRTLRDEYIRLDAIKLKNDYLAKEFEVVNQTIVDRQVATQNVIAITHKYQLPSRSPWWSRAIDYLIRCDEGQQLVAKVHYQLESHDLRGRLGEESLSSFVSIATKFREASGLSIILSRCLDEMTKARKKVLEAVIGLSARPSVDDLNAAIDCHLRPQLDKEGRRVNGDGRKCVYCLIHEMFNGYEAKLFYFSQAEKTEEEMEKETALMDKLRRGTWADSEAEQSLKIVFSMVKSKSNLLLTITDDVELLVADGNTQMKHFEALKKEFRALRGVWMQIRDHVALIDELNMATMRLRLRYDHEPKPPVPVPYILERGEIASQLIKLRSDETIAKNQLTKKLSHLMFLHNLQKADFGCRGGSNPEPCPICQSAMGTQWAVFESCGHSFCVKCVDIMITRYGVVCGQTKKIKCAMCRSLCPLNDILYVDSQADNQDGDEVPVEGSWSTKVEEIVRRLLTITKDQPEAKSLVFSSWYDVLELVSKALHVNDYRHVIVKHSSKFSDLVDQFKQDPNVRAMLLPLASGSKGLNLIEATHVILVEPTLNQANELQAVGRVHRIGQTKPTFVHKFLVRSTIEERIAELYSASHNSDQLNPDPSTPQLAQTSECAFMTLDDVRLLFEDQ